MIAVLFEVIPKAGESETYLEVAKSLRPLLDNLEGFISVERFQSLTNPQKMLSLSFWKDKDSITQWRNLEAHRAAQHQGRHMIFEEYRLRVAGIIRDYGMTDRAQAPTENKTIY
uniref:Antibiotic biosynthesis monooxygenase n=1 Tax=Roseihalotalea indica TaxID=2867963 RepID=A0AA49JIG6_9BACT|nr:antibiotic biosynthesis monooxygenase [Tunicatimonas sp. TK19036]